MSNKLLKNVIIPLMVLLVISMAGFVNILQGQTTKEEREAARDRFNREYNNQWSIRWNNLTGTPSSILTLGHGTIIYSGTPEQIAMEFFNEYKIMFGIEDVERDLELKKIEHLKGGIAGDGTILKYTQKYKGIPVFNKGYLIAMFNYGSISYVSGNYFPDVSVETTKPALSPEQAISAINADLSGFRTKIIEKPELCIYVVDFDKETMSYLLAYKAAVEIDEENILGAWKYIIDAQNGVIVSKNSLVSTWGSTYPKEYSLSKNYPNPFNSITTIEFQLPEGSYVTLVVYDILGREVSRLVDDYVESGYHSVKWDASNAASGIYIYRFQSRLSGFTDTKRMLYIK